MSSIATLFPRWGSTGRWHTVVAGLLTAALALLAMAGYGPGGSACRALGAPSVPSVSLPSVPADTAAAVTGAAASAAPAVAAAVTPAAAPVPPAAKVYFAVDRTNVTDEGKATLGEVIAYLKANAGAKATVSGFHDPTGSRAHNEELALNRAKAVRTAIEEAGIPADRVVMAKPAETTGTGDPREARRVEVSVQP